MILQKRWVLQQGQPCFTSRQSYGVSRNSIKLQRLVKGTIWASINNNDQVNLLLPRCSWLSVCSRTWFWAWLTASPTEAALYKAKALWQKDRRSSQNLSLVWWVWILDFSVKVFYIIAILFKPNKEKALLGRGFILFKVPLMGFCS